jgi:hypothetical protein
MSCSSAVFTMLPWLMVSVRVTKEVTKDVPFYSEIYPGFFDVSLDFFDFIDATAMLSFSSSSLSSSV